MVLEFLTHPSNSPYFFALCFLVMLFVFELLTLLVGASLSHAVDNLVDFDAELGGYLSILGLGKVPLIIWLTFFIGLFCALGYGANAVAIGVFGYLPIWLSLGPVTIVSLLLNGKSCQLFSLYFPRYETTAVSTDTFAGRLAKLTVGDATFTKFAMGVVLDEHNTSHNIRVQAIDADAVLAQNTQVVLVEQIKGSAIWLAIPYQD